MNDKILIIEDNVFIIDELEIRLCNLGYTVIGKAISGAEAIKIAEDSTPDLIISDIDLGEGIDGIETIETINSKQNIPVIYLTAFDDDLLVSRAQTTEPYAYLTKPVQEKELSIAIKMALYKHQTEKKLIESNKELIKINAEKDIFVSIMAHDLKNALSSNMQLVELLCSGKLDEAKTQRFLSHLNVSFRKSLDLLSSLIKWGKATQNKEGVKRGDVSPYSLVENVKGLYQQQLADKVITLSNCIAESDVVSTDKDMLEFILRNLISNSIKYTSHNGKIEVSCLDNNEHYEFCVSDTGKGMPAKKLESIFSLDSIRSEPGTDGEEGHGLGLQIIKEYVRLLKGEIWAESEEGKGTKVFFSICKHI